MNTSPGSYFYAQGRSIILASKYFSDDRLKNSQPGTAQKHRTTFRSALFVQLMANLEYFLKDFAGRLVELTSAYDEEVQSLDWINVDIQHVLGHRGEEASIQGILFHPTSRWYDPTTVNKRYRKLFEYEVVSNEEVSHLRRLWILRHSLAHNGGYVSRDQAHRMKAPTLAAKNIAVSHDFIREGFDFLKQIVRRACDLGKDKVLPKWAEEDATGDWTRDEESFVALWKALGMVESRPKEVPEPSKGDYEEIMEMNGMEED